MSLIKPMSHLIQKIKILNNHFIKQINHFQITKRNNKIKFLKIKIQQIKN